MNTIESNLRAVQANIDAACERSGRSSKEVTLIAVSKTKPIEMLREAYAAGVRDFGENKVQELMDKIPQMPPDVRWHLIGHLQTNKVKYIVDRVHLIHSVDSLRLAEVISREAVRRQTDVSVLVEVNAAGEESKFGIRPEETCELVERIASLPGILVKGLMTIAPMTQDMDKNRPFFQKIRNLAVDIRGKNIDNITMNILSMGMTGDYVAAIEEGATCVRVGTGIFGERSYL